MFSEFIKRILDNERESLSNRQENTMPDVIVHKSSKKKQISINPTLKP